MVATTGSGTTKLYADGLLVSSKDGTHTLQQTTRAYHILGASNWGSLGYFFKGTIAYSSFWHGHILTPTEITQLYEARDVSPFHDVPTCPPGQGYNTTATACNACPEGKYNDVDDYTTCTSCAAGKYNPTAAADTPDACVNCSAGTASPTAGANDAAACASCAAGRYAHAAATECTVCSAGKFGEDAGASSATACTNCPAGTASPTAGASDAAACESCAAGKYATARAGGASECELCPAGSYSETAASSKDACLSCPSGQQLNSENSGCEDCPPGYFIDTEGDSACLPCGSGMYTLSAASASCFACGAGKSSEATTATTADTCVDCAAGRYMATSGAASCTACGVNTFNPSNASITADDCVECVFGKITYFSTDTAAEEQCLPEGCDKMCFAANLYDSYGDGWNGDYLNFMDSRGSVEASVTQSDSVAAATADSIEVCLIVGCYTAQVGGGSYTSETSWTLTSSDSTVAQSSGSAPADFCVTDNTCCPEGSERSSTSSTCITCGSGTYGYGGPCIPCGGGFFNPSSSSTSPSSCAACPAGTSSSALVAASAASCSPCTAGTFSSPGSTSCTPCPPSTYNSEPSSSSCLACPTILTSNGGSSSISDCYDPAAIYFNLHGTSPPNRIEQYDHHASTFSTHSLPSSPLSSPSSLVFPSPTSLLSTSTATDEILEFRSDGAFRSIFAIVPSPRCLLLLAAHVAVCSEDQILFVGLDDAVHDSPIEAIMLPDAPLALTIAPDDQLLVVTTVSVSLVCIPNTTCSHSPIGVLAKSGTHIASLSSSPTVQSELQSCPANFNVEEDFGCGECGEVAGSCFDYTCAEWVDNDDDADIASVQEIFDNPCGVWTEDDGVACTCPCNTPTSVGVFWPFLLSTPTALLKCTTTCSDFSTVPLDFAPSALLVDDEQELVLVVDADNFKVHAFDYLGNLIHSLYTPSPLTSLVFKPGAYLPLSTLTLPPALSAVDPITLTLSTFDRHNVPTPPEPLFNLNLTLTADGLISLPEKNIELPFSVSAPVSSYSPSISIAHAGSWTFSLSPLSQTVTGTVLAGPTVAATSTVSHNKTIIAGHVFRATVLPFDEHLNPSPSTRDSFEAYFDDDESAVPLTGYLLELPLTRSGTHTFKILATASGGGGDYGDEVSAAQFAFQIDPSAPSVPVCRHSLEGITTFDPSTGAKLTLQAFLFDEFNNSIVDSTDFIIVIDGDLSNEVRLEPPQYRHELAFAEDETRKIMIGFLSDAHGLEHLPNSPITIQVSPDSSTAETLTVEVQAAIGASVVLIALVAYLFIKRNQRIFKAKIETVVAMSKEKDERHDASFSELKKEASALKLSLEQKQHNEEELAIMKQSRQELSQERESELRGVLINSDDVEVLRLLGKGGFGVVNLGTYKGAHIAVKQLLTMTDDSVKRFR